MAVEQNYHPTEEDELAIVLAIKHYKQYLNNTEFVVEIDHKSLIYLKTNNNLFKPQIRWIEWRMYEIYLLSILKS